MEDPAVSQPTADRSGTRRAGRHGLRRPTEPAVVVAPADLHDDLVALAGRHRRHVLRCFDADRLADLAAAVEGCELVVHASLFDAVSRQAPDAFELMRELRLVGRFCGPDGSEAIVVDDPWVPVVSTTWSAVRRMLDVSVAFVGLLLTLPILVAAAIAIRVETRGRPLFTQTRVGWHGRRFTVFKLRTMREGNTDRQHRAYVAAQIRGEATTVDGMFKLARDPRVTRVGSFLRRSSIDELPQLWNVLRGEMSLIGPRPDLPSTMAQCDGYVWLRQRVRPGLTGLWQVSGRSLLPFGEMVELDNRYCAEVGPAMDLAILARTPRVIFGGTGSA